jgi:TP901 family phage tail tape measure protein
MSMVDQVSYQERIVVVIDEAKLSASIATAEKNYNAFIQKIAKQKNIELQINAKDNATSAFAKVASQGRRLTSRPHVVTVNTSGNAETQLRTMRTQATQLGARAVTIRVNASGTAQQTISNLTRTARQGINVPVRAASNVIGAVAPSVIGMEAPAVGGALMAGGAVAGGLAIATTLGVATKNAMDFNNEIVQVQNNTTMTSDETATLSRNVLDLSAKFGLSQEPLITAARQIQDLTQNADAMNGILNVASETAAATGADVGQTGAVLANTLHQYKLDQGSVSQVQLNAAHAMGVLHLASAEGNMTMQQFADSSGRAIALAGQLGVPLEQVTAGMAALTRNGYDAAQSQTQLVNIFTRIIKPAADSQKQIEALSKTSGVDLVSAYSATGLSTLGLTGIFARTTEAYQKMGMSQSDATAETLKLMNAQRGGLGAALLMGKGADDFNQILGDLTNTQLTDTYVNQAWDRSMQQPSVQMQILGQRIHVAMIELGDHFVPAVNHAFTWLDQLRGPLADVGEQLGRFIGPILGVSDPLGGMDTIVQDLALGLHNMSTWLGEVATEADKNGALSDLHTAFTNIVDALGPAMAVLDPFRAGLSDVDTSAHGIDDGSHGAAEGIKAFAEAAKAVTGEIQPFLDLLTDIEKKLNAITAFENAHRPQVTVAGQEQKGLVNTVPLQVEQAAGEGVTPVQAVQNMWDYWFGGRQQKISEAERAMGTQSATVGEAITKGMADSINTHAPDVYDETRALAQQTISTTQDELDSHSPSGKFMKEGQNIVLGFAQGISTQSSLSIPGAVQDMVSLVRSSFSGAMSANAAGPSAGGAVSGSLNDWINSAISQSNVDPNHWAGNLQALIMHESSGNPNARNDWDVNAKAGNASVGLGQLTGTNRAAYTPAGMDPMDPTAQVMATINYIKDRYGDISNVPGIRSLAAGGAYKPYASGGLVTEPSLMVSARTGRAWGTIAESGAERVIPTALSAGAAGTAVVGGQFAPSFTIVQQPGEDGAELAGRINTHLQNLVPQYLHRFSQHIGESLSNMPTESFS